MYYNELEYYNMSLLHLICDEKWFLPENSIIIIKEIYSKYSEIKDHVKNENINGANMSVLMTACKSSGTGSLNLIKFLIKEFGADPLFASD